MIRYIGKGQAAVMTALFGVVYCIIAKAYYATGEMLMDTVMTVLILAVMMIPMCLLASSGKGSAAERCREKLGIFGGALDLLYFAYLVCAAADILKRYSIFVSERYFREGGAAVCTVMLGLVCLYISHTGAETVSRMSTVLLFLMVLTSVIFAAGAYKDIAAFDIKSITLPKITLSDGFKGLFPIASAGAVCLCMLSGGLEKRTPCGVYSGIASLLAVTVLILTAVSAVMGGYVYSSEYPLTDAVIYASRNSTFRNDGLFFTLWTVIAAAVISLLCTCGGHALKSAFPKLKGEGAISAGSAVICAVTALLSGREFCSAVYETPVISIVLVSAVPLLLMIAEKFSKKEAVK